MLPYAGRARVGSNRGAKLRAPPPLCALPGSTMRSNVIEQKKLGGASRAAISGLACRALGSGFGLGTPRAEQFSMSPRNERAVQLAFLKSAKFTGLLARDATRLAAPHGGTRTAHGHRHAPAIKKAGRVSGARPLLPLLAIQTAGARKWRQVHLKSRAPMRCALKSIRGPRRASCVCPGGVGWHV